MRPLYDNRKGISRGLTQDYDLTILACVGFSRFTGLVRGNTGVKWDEEREHSLRTLAFAGARVARPFASGSPLEMRICG